MANNLAYLRYKAGLTQAELGKKLGVSKQMISYLELGRNPLSIRHRIKLAAVLGVNEDDIKTNIEEIV